MLTSLDRCYHQSAWKSDREKDFYEKMNQIDKSDSDNWFSLVIFRPLSENNQVQVLQAFVFERPESDALTWGTCTTDDVPGRGGATGNRKSTLKQHFTWHKANEWTTLETFPNSESIIFKVWDIFFPLNPNTGRVNVWWFTILSMQTSVFQNGGQEALCGGFPAKNQNRLRSCDITYKEPLLGFKLISL